MHSMIARARKNFHPSSNFYLTLFLSIFITFLLPSVTAAGESADHLFAKGVESYNSFSDSGINLSVELFEAAIKENPGFSPAYSALAEGYVQKYYRTGENDKPLLKEAFALAERALFLDAKSPVAHKTLGTVYFASGKVEEAIEEIERAVDMDPAYARAWLNLGTCYYVLGNRGDARKYFLKAAELKNDPLAEGIAYYNLASADAEEGDYISALASYRKGGELVPGYHNIHYGIGIALMHLDRDPEAVDAFKRALELKSDDAVLHMGLASAYHRMGNKSGAKEAYERVLELDPENEDATRGLRALEGKRLGPLISLLAAGAERINPPDSNVLFYISG